MSVSLDRYTFGGVKFGPRAEEAIPRVNPPETFVSERHVPYSNFSIVDLGGKAGVRHVAASVRLTPALMGPFEALLLVTDTLVWDLVEYPGATLVKLENKRITPRREYYWVDAEWLVP